MPFFSQNPWMEKVGRIWLWVILTIPATIFAFLFYTYWKRRQWRVKTTQKDTENGNVRMRAISLAIESDDED
jgi:heme/copper-type cytochrome/quinol oxidase subunit 2